MIVKSFYFEDEQRVILLGGIPFSWIKENHTTTIQNLHTHQGQINLEAKIIDDAIQVYGGCGVTEDVGLARAYAHTRILRIADGPDEVHRNQIARLELKKHM